MSSAARAMRRRQERERAKSARDRRLTVHHGTSLARVPWIMQTGLQPSEPSEFNPTGTGPWVTPDRDHALMYALRAVSVELHEQGRLTDEDVSPAIGAILTLRVDRDDLIGDPSVSEFQLPDGCRPGDVLAHELIDLSAGVEAYPPDVRVALVVGDAPALGLHSKHDRFDSFAVTGVHRPPETMPDALRLAIEAGATNPPGRSLIHGEEHWKAVAIVGLELARTVKGADPRFVVTFALLHDVMRQSDGEDPEHGVRAAKLFERLCDQLRGFWPGGKRAAAMLYALANHNTVQTPTVGDVNVGICWDADRLNLLRLGRTVDPAFLTTDVARRPAMLDFTEALLSEPVELEKPWRSIQQLADSMA